MEENDKSSVRRDTVFESVWADLKNIYSVQLEQMPWYAGKLAEADLQKWAQKMSASKEEVCNQVAIRLAQGFHKHELDFTFCDAVINDLFQTDTGSTGFKGIFWQVYLAFDAGEFYREGKKDEDPSEIYTRPLIAEIVNSMESKGSE